ncbi:MAG: hypothetical protein HRU07_03905 [Nitrosopumilus sp.]|nr:hypothetical protein [Nitrosopumilus sp.]NRA05300.1 hypothetical protein [Nitrosopumilus sp.]
MTLKTGYFGGFVLGIILYSFSNAKILGSILANPAQNFLEIFIPVLTAIAIIITIGMVFKKIRIDTTERGLLFGAVSTIAVFNIVLQIFPNLL